jgi:hypothetical protein
MDEDIKSQHGDQCKCTYCDKETQKETESILKGQAFDELSDGMGNNGYATSPMRTMQQELCRM